MTTVPLRTEERQTTMSFILQDVLCQVETFNKFLYHILDQVYSIVASDHNEPLLEQRNILYYIVANQGFTKLEKERIKQKVRQKENTRSTRYLFHLYKTSLASLSQTPQCVWPTQCPLVRDVNRPISC